MATALLSFDKVNGPQQMLLHLTPHVNCPPGFIQNQQGMFYILPRRKRLVKQLRHDWDGFTRCSPLIVDT